MYKRQWSITLHDPTGILSHFDSQEAQFVLGTEVGPDVLTVAGEGVAPRHARVSITEGHMEVEDLAGGTLVNGHPIEDRVDVGYPVSVQAGAVTLVVVSGFTVKVVAEGRKATRALARLQETAPTFATRAEDALREGNFEEALKSIDFAVDLEPKNGGYHALRGNVLQVLVRWPEAVLAYQAAMRHGESDKAQSNLSLTEALLAQAKKEGEAKAKGALFEALNSQGRQYEAMAFGKELGDFWKDRKKDPSALPELVKRLEAKLLPVPGTEVLLSKTEFTVGEWKLYLKAEGLPDWQQPSKDWVQTDEDPVVKISWNKAKEFCDWLSVKTCLLYTSPSPRD